MDWAQIQANAVTGKKLTALSDLSAVLILSLRPHYAKRRFWSVGDTAPNDADWNDIDHAISQMEDEIMRGLIGAIIPHVMADISDFEALECDGSIYLRVDYPELYAVISPDLIIDADNFRVPDLVGRFPRGADIAEAIGNEGGEKEHVLTEDEIPAHSHTNFPHSHSEITATPFPTLVGAGAPAVYAVSGVGVTGSASITIDNTGGSQAHNNEPQYTALKWLIVAR